MVPYFTCVQCSPICMPECPEAHVILSQNYTFYINKLHSNIHYWTPHCIIWSTFCSRLFCARLGSNSIETAPDDWTLIVCEVAQCRLSKLEKWKRSSENDFYHTSEKKPEKPKLVKEKSHFSSSSLHLAWSDYRCIWRIGGGQKRKVVKNL